MFRKVLINIFFEKKWFLAAFLLVFTALLSYVGLQAMFMEKQRISLLSNPDIVYNGDFENEDGSYTFILYKDIGGFSAKVKEVLGQAAKVYGGICRNISTNQDPVTKMTMSYKVNGMDDEFIDRELKGYIRDGRLPAKGKKEAVIGAYASKFYKLKVGDVIPLPLTLIYAKDVEDFKEKDWNQYTVSGILDDNLVLFKGDFIISQNTFKQYNGEKVEENITYIYFNSNDDKSNVDSYMKIENIKNNYNISRGVPLFYESNYYEKGVVVNAITFLSISLIILFLLTSYLMKGVSEKVGLLKALGISNMYIFKTFVGGLCVIVLVALGVAIPCINLVKNLLNDFTSDFVGYSVQEYTMNYTVYSMIFSIAILLFFAVFMIIFIRSTRVSPKDAMMKK